MFSQGSAATYFRYGEIYNYYFLTNFALNLAVKEFWKSINISQSYRPEKGVLFFDSQCRPCFTKGEVAHPTHGGVGVGKFEHHYFGFLWSMSSPSKKIAFGTFCTRDYTPFSTIWAKIVSDFMLKWTISLSEYFQQLQWKNHMSEAMGWHSLSVIFYRHLQTIGNAVVELSALGLTLGQFTDSTCKHYQLWCILPLVDLQNISKFGNIWQHYCQMEKDVIFITVDVNACLPITNLKWLIMA